MSKYRYEKLQSLSHRIFCNYLASLFFFFFSPQSNPLLSLSCSSAFFYTGPSLVVLLFVVLLLWRFAGWSKLALGFGPPKKCFEVVDKKIISERVRGREEHTFCGYGGFWLRNFCFWWKKWCVFGWKVGFAVGLRKEHWGRKVYRVLWDWGRSVGGEKFIGFLKSFILIICFFLKYCADVKNYGSFKSFGYIYRLVL